MQLTYTLAALQDEPSRLFSNRSKLKAKIRIQGPFFPKKKLGGSYFTKEALLPFLRAGWKGLKRKRTLNLNLFNHSSTKMAAPYRFVDRDDDTRKSYYARVKNKFKWEWLTEKDTHGDFLSSDIRKIDANRFAWCCFYRNVVNYSNSGKACFRCYAKSKVDQRERRLNKTNHQLPAAIQATQDKISGSVKLQMPLLWIGPES